MNTAGQIITNCGRFYINQNEGMQSKSPLMRSRLRFFLKGAMSRAWTVAPLNQRHGNGTVSIDTTGKGTFPTDFSGIGSTVSVFLTTGGVTPLVYMSEQQLLANLTQWPDQGQPINWTRTRQTAATGLAQMQVWPPPAATSSVTVNGYNRACLDPIDFPGVPTAASGEAGNLTGAYKWKAAYEWADGTTEGGFESATLTVAAKQVAVTVPISESRHVTEVVVYRIANGGLIFKEAGSVVPSNSTIVTVGGVQCVQFTDNTADSDLGANCPIPSAAMTGVEQFPDDFIETLLTEGLVARAMTSQGDLRDAGFWQQFLKECRRMWADQKPGQSQGRQLIQFGQRRDAGSPLDVRFRYNG
jgi:hypothetical protein